MKHKFLLKTMLLLSALIAGSGSAWADDATFDFTSMSTVAAGSQSFTDGEITVECSNGAVSAQSGTMQLRWYSGQTLTVSAATGYEITAISITKGASDKGTISLDSGSGGTLGGQTSSGSGNVATWTGAEESVTFSTSGQSRVTNILVTYESTGGSSTPTISADPTSLSDFTYIAGEGPSDAQTVSVSGSNLTANISLSLGENSNYEMCQTANGTYTNILTLTPSEGTVSATDVYVRLKSGLTKADYDGTLTISSTDASSVEVSLSGSVTGQTYTLTDESGENGSIGFSDTPVEAGTHVTLTPTPTSSAYYFVEGSWSFFNDNLDEVTSEIEFVTGESNVIVMPAYNLHVDATFTAKPTFAVTCATSGNGTIEASPASAYEGQTVGLNITPAEGYMLSSVVITKTEDGSATGITVTNNQFTMPAYAVTATATFVSNIFEGNFVKVTSSNGLVDNGYYVIYNTNAMNSTLSSGQMGGTDVKDILDSDNDIISNPDRSIVWKLEADGNNWKLYNEKEGKYCYIEGTTTSSFKMGTTSSYSYSITGEEDFTFATTHSSGRCIAYNGGVFKSYAASNNPTVNLYKYTILTKRTITFNGNGGTYNDATSYTQEVNDGVATALTANQFTNSTPNTAFAGWATTADGEVVYADGASVTLNADLTLYAKWSTSYTATVSNSIANGTVKISTAGGEVTSTTTAEGAEVALTQTADDGYRFSAWDVYKADNASTKVIVSENKFSMPAFDVIISATFEEIPSTTYTLATSVTPGKTYIIASGTDGDVYAMGYDKGNNRDAVSVKAVAGQSTSTITVEDGFGVYELVLYGPDANEKYTFYDANDVDGPGYLYAIKGSNYLKTQSTIDSNGKWSISFDDNNGNAIIQATAVKNDSEETRIMRFNNSSNPKLFSCYTSGQQDIYLYEKSGEPVATTVSKTLNGSGYATFAITSALDFLDADNASYSAWQITSIEGSTINFTQIKETIAAGTGILLKGAANSQINLNILPVGGATLSDNKLVGTTADFEVVNDGDYYGLSGQTFVKVKAGTVSAGKALLPKSVVEGSGVKAFTFVFEGDDATGVETIDNGQLTIDNEIYDLQGRRVQKPSKGLYIVNGKKVLF